MKIIKGKYKGKEFQISQYCNDWFSVKEAPLIFSPTMIELSTAEMLDLWRNAKSTGIMFGLYELLPTGRFKKIRRSHDQT